MKLIQSLSDLDAAILRNSSVSIGNFDGVHRGHARLVERLVARARQLAGPAVVFTFDPHPATLLRPETAPIPLTWAERKAELLGRLGVDIVVAYPTSRDLLALAPEDFFSQILQQSLAARAIVEGPDFSFGRNRAGTIEVLRGFCRDHGVSLEVVDPLEHAGQAISSSRIRQCVARGKMDEARSMLTQPYRLRGLVVEGAARGRQLGFPTANLDRIDTVVPGFGVYAGWSLLPSGRWPSAIHVGPCPTFGEMRARVEVHLIGFSGSLYGQLLEVDFLTRLRDILAFPDVGSLTRQLQQDVATATEACRSEA